MTGATNRLNGRLRRRRQNLQRPRRRANLAAHQDAPSTLLLAELLLCADPADLEGTAITLDLRRGADGALFHDHVAGVLVGTELDHVLGFAKAQGLPGVRWLTQEFNYAARRLYDTYSSKTDFILYNVAV